MNNFAERIKELRKEQGLSQKALAERLGCTQSMISFWENGVNEPTESSIRKVALFFNVSADFLIGLSDD
ncbi:MAG: helix-turn-helix transcriptional regulator [Clostridia bacterium]|nr:helix-turn-helix transcriptional regulator [Clostridia bacterium]MBQ8446875.1 helix-turn-helix transcriptional regulator [Clostridia bacterium]MBQ8447242.1 helix-turn-helix transcriptional regulator [Clostridia bacterium]